MKLQNHRPTNEQNSPIPSDGARITNSFNGARSPLHSTALTVGFLLGFIPTVVSGKPTDGDLAELKRMLLQQQSIIQEQERRLRKQEELLRQLTEQRSVQPPAMVASEPALPIATPDNKASIASDSSIVSKTSADGRLANSPSPGQPALPAKAPPPVIATQPSTKTTEKSQLAATQKGLSGPEPERDSVGDLNAAGVRAGTFPGSIKIPGPYDVSVAIGGFAKTAVIVDTNQESSGADFLPALLGTRRKDQDGNTSIDASLTRFNLDVRAPTKLGDLRSYVEFDLNKNNNGTLDPKLRHAYGTWKSAWGTLTAGQTWTTFMDTQILPEGLTEPTVSGAIFQRQPLLRWSQALAPKISVDLAIEDPNSNDVFSDQPDIGRSPSPDVIGAVEFAEKGIGHLRLASIYRRIELDRDSGGSTARDGWGISAGAHLDTFTKDRFMLAGNYGSGVGRYLLGIAPAAGGVVDPSTNELTLRTNFGGMTAYQRYWTDYLHSNFAVGYAQAETLSGQPDNAFKSTVYTYANLMWNILPYLTVGLEYDYGVRKNLDGNTIDNSRFMLGVQMF